ncbi:hypothetical protein [Candidatus Fukatsuia endosymbiont of Tuberolachnus salignus]|uniref:hypothetical protein n=2 Tax=Yersiniaceae TaxID=1903411 RepID=UPI00313D2AFC
MNKKLQQWLAKPAWQLLFWQWSLFIVLVCFAYLLELQPIWQKRASKQQELVTQQNRVEQTRKELASLPTLSLTQHQINELLSKEQSRDATQHTLELLRDRDQWCTVKVKETQQSLLTGKHKDCEGRVIDLKTDTTTTTNMLIEHVGKSLTAFGGQIVHWQRQALLPENSLIRQHWSVTVAINFQGLIYFLYDVLNIYPPILIEQMHITREKDGLIVKLRLTEFSPNDGSNE